MKKIILSILILTLFIPAICRADIELLGSDSQEEIKIAEKYSPFYQKNIKIEIINKLMLQELTNKIKNN